MRWSIKFDDVNFSWKNEIGKILLACESERHNTSLVRKDKDAVVALVTDFYLQKFNSFDSCIFSVWNTSFILECYYLCTYVSRNWVPPINYIKRHLQSPSGLYQTDRVDCIWLGGLANVGVEKTLSPLEKLEARNNE